MQRLIGLIFVLAFATLGCGIFTPKGSDRDSWPTPVISTEEAQNLEDNVRDAAKQLDSNLPVVLVISESQLTSFVALRLEEQAITAVQDPQIFLRDGKVLANVTYNEGGAALKMSVDIKFLLNDGVISVMLEAIRLNGFSAPMALVNKAQIAITEQVQPALNEYLTKGMYVDSLVIADGTLTLTGKKP